MSSMSTGLFCRVTFTKERNEKASYHWIEEDANTHHTSEQIMLLLCIQAQETTPTSNCWEEDKRHRIG